MTIHRRPPTCAYMEPLEPRLLLATTVFYDGFEGTFPDGWTTTSTVTAKWGDNSARVAAGDWSLFCADTGGTAGNERETYDCNMYTCIEHGGLSLAGYTTAALTFQYWMNCEENESNPAEPYDYFMVLARDQYGMSQNLFFDSGDDSALGWQTKTLDLTPYAGQTNLTIQFRFVSDEFYVPDAPSGVWVDEVKVIGNPRPDLIGWDCYAPNAAFWGQTISLRGQVKNIGTVGAGAFTQRFYLSADTTWGNADDVLLGSYSHAALAAGTIGPDFNLSSALPGDPPSAAYQPSGTYYIGMKTDALAAVTESDETNNSPGGALNQWFDWDDISIGYNTHVDLTLYQITDTSGTPNSANPGQAKTTFNPGETARVTLKATNTGVSRSVQTGLVLYGPDNTTVVYDSHDPLKTSSGHVEDVVAALAVGATGYYSFDWTLPSGAVPGAYDLVGAIRDSANWNYVLDNTATGAGTVGFGPEARVREALWRTQTAPANRTSDDTSEYLMGKVCVNVVLPSSEGANSTEDWTIQEIADIRREVTEGTAWWTTTLPDAHLSFQLDFTYADNPISTAFEPISQTVADEAVWIDDMLAVLSPGTTGTTDQRLRTYADLTRRASNSDWAFTVFVVDDTNDADHAFDGSGDWFAYADLGGPKVVMTYHNDGWGIDDMGLVFAHEMAHIFYALDEYSGSDLYTDRSGYLNIQNLNAIDDNPHPNTVVPSLMGEGDMQTTAFAGHTSSPTSLQMIGYRDTDADHILDILDTTPSISTSVIASNAVTGAIQVQATGAIVPLANNNPEGMKHAISLNTISGVQYKVDGGSWTDLPAQNGSYDEQQETAVLQLSGLSGGSHHIYLRVRSSVGAWSPLGNYSSVADLPFTVNQSPVVGSLAAAPNPVVLGTDVLLTAGATDADGSVVSVAFYRESNAAPGLQTGAGGDLLLGTDSVADTWTWTASTGSLAAATYTYYAQATDNVGAVSATGAAATFVAVIVQNPTSEQWSGGTSGQWNNPANWALGFVPGPGTVAVFDGPVTKQPVLGQNQEVKGIDIRSAGWRLDLAGHTLVVGAGGILLPGGGSPTAALDLGDGFLAINYDTTSPIGDVAQWIAAAYSGGDWDGNGIGSAVLELNPTSNFGIGVAENVLLPNKFGVAHPFGGWTGADDTTVLVRYTLIGDVNLDGIVNDADISLVTVNYGSSGVGWLGGDVFGYDDIVNDSDVSLTTNNYGSSVGQLTGGLSDPTDPATLGHPALGTALASGAGVGQASAASSGPAVVALLLASGGAGALVAGQPAVAEAEPVPDVLREAAVMAVRPAKAAGLAAAADGVLCLSGGAEPELIQLII